MIESLKSIGDIYKKMPTEDAARRFLEDLIWPEGRVCPHCGEKHSTELRGLSHRPGLYQCRDCRRQFSVTTRTPLHATKLDLRVWVLALYIILNSSKGVSSVVLARMVGITQKAAWRIGYAVREMMWDSFEDGVRLDGVVEVDEAYVGGAPKFKQGKKNPRGRGTKKEAVLVAVERGRRARAAKMDANDAAHIRPLVTAWVDPSATLMTDSSQSYKAIGKLYDAHLMVKHGPRSSPTRSPARTLTPPKHSPLRSNGPASASFTGSPATTPNAISTSWFGGGTIGSPATG